MVDNSIYEVDKSSEQQPHNDASLALLIQRCRTLYEVEQEKAELDLQMKEINKKLNNLKFTEIPELMTELDMEEVPLNNGWKVTGKPEIKGSIPSSRQVEKAYEDGDAMAEEMDKRRKAAMKWLSENDHNIIKHEFTVDLGKAPGNKLAALCDLAVEMGFEYSVDESVHHSTLTAFVREMVKKGDSSLPWDVFSVTDATVGKLVKPRKPSGK